MNFPVSRVGDGWNARPFARAHLPLPVVGPRAAGRRRLCHDEHGFMDGLNHRETSAGMRRISFNTDWRATRSSIKELANLKPNVVACGHGVPIASSDLPNRLLGVCEWFRPPRHGRYVDTPASTDENGITSLPPAPFDPVPFATAAALVCVGVALGAGYLDDKRR